MLDHRAFERAAEIVQGIRRHSLGHAPRRRTVATGNERIHAVLREGGNAREQSDHQCEKCKFHFFQASFVFFKVSHVTRGEAVAPRTTEPPLYQSWRGALRSRGFAYRRVLRGVAMG